MHTDFTESGLMVAVSVPCAQEPRAVLSLVNPWGINGRTQAHGHTFTWKEEDGSAWADIGQAYINHELELPHGFRLVSCLD